MNVIYSTSVIFRREDLSMANSQVIGSVQRRLEKKRTEFVQDVSILPTRHEGCLRVKSLRRNLMDWAANYLIMRHISGLNPVGTIPVS